jgi:hypothetical protein
MADRAVPSDLDNRRQRERLIWLVIAVFFLMNCILVSFSVGRQFFNGQSQWLPIALHSLLQADYSADERRASLPAVQIDVVGDYINDQNVPNQPINLATIENNLDTPVPTVTPQSQGTVQLFTATSTQQSGGSNPVPSITPTPTPSQPAAVTQEPSQTSETSLITPTNIPTGTHRPTLTPTEGDTPTNPPDLPTRTPSPTERPVTDTPLPPTLTDLPPTATETAVPPTRTPTRPPPTNTPIPYPYPGFAGQKGK